MLSWSVDRVAVIPQPKPKPKHSLLSVLVVLFLVSYGLLSLLVVEQGRTIDAQRHLIQQLFGDSTQLTKMKADAFQKQRADEQARAHQQAQQAPQVAPHKEAEKPRHSDRIGKPAPERPPREASDDTDERRILISI